MEYEEEERYPDARDFAEKLLGLLSQRDPHSHKGDYGKCYVLGGSRKYVGAPMIATRFALLGGPGYVTLSVPSSIEEASRVLVPFEVCHIPSLPSGKEGDDLLPEEFPEGDSLLFGNGMADSPGNRRLLGKILSKFPGNVLIDGTGIRMIAAEPSLLEERKEGGHVLLLPHPGEASALFGHLSPEKVDWDVLAAEAEDFSDAYGVDILLKGSSSLFLGKDDEEDGVEIESVYEPVPSLARAGSGDALAGFLAGLLAHMDKSMDFGELVMGADHLFHEAARSLAGKVGQTGLNLDLLEEEMRRFLADCQSL